MTSKAKGRKWLTPERRARLERMTKARLIEELDRLNSEGIDRVDLIEEQLAEERKANGAAVARARQAAEVLVEELGPDGGTNVDELAELAAGMIRDYRTEMRAADEVLVRYGKPEGLTWVESLGKLLARLSREKSGAEHRARRAAQILIEEIGGAGPEYVDATAERAVAKIRDLRERVEVLSEKSKAWRELADDAEQLEQRSRELGKAEDLRREVERLGSLYRGSEQRVGELLRDVEDYKRRIGELINPPEGLVYSGGEEQKQGDPAAEFCPRCGLSFDELPDYVPEGDELLEWSAKVKGTLGDVIEALDEVGAPAHLTTAAGIKWLGERLRAAEASVAEHGLDRRRLAEVLDEVGAPGGPALAERIRALGREREDYRRACANEPAERRIVCPTCQTDLTFAASLRPGEVSCGSCGWRGEVDACAVKLPPAPVTVKLDGKLVEAVGGEAAAVGALREHVEAVRELKAAREVLARAGFANGRLDEAAEAVVNCYHLALEDRAEARRELARIHVSASTALPKKSASPEQSVLNLVHEIDRLRSKLASAKRKSADERRDDREIVDAIARGLNATPEEVEAFAREAVRSPGPGVSCCAYHATGGDAAFVCGDDAFDPAENRPLRDDFPGCSGSEGDAEARGCSDCDTREPRLVEVCSTEYLAKVIKRAELPPSSWTDGEIGKIARSHLSVSRALGEIDAILREAAPIGVKGAASSNTQGMGPIDLAAWIAARFKIVNHKLREARGFLVSIERAIGKLDAAAENFPAHMAVDWLVARYEDRRCDVERLSAEVAQLVEAEGEQRARALKAEADGFAKGEAIKALNSEISYLKDGADVLREQLSGAKIDEARSAARAQAFEQAHARALAQIDIAASDQRKGTKA